MKFYLPLSAVAGLLALSGCVEPSDASAPPPPPSVVYADQPAPPPSAGGPSETTYVPPGTYATAPSYSQDDYEDDEAPVPQEGEVEVETVQDFDEPLQPYGDWVVVANYGRCWRPRQVDSGWRPYCNGQWVDTDQGWYWQSDEPWGWATYHYGRWDFQAGSGWIWIPHTRWAPAWVEWRSGGGYVGWAPLPPGARFNHGRDFHDVHARDRDFVFVHENHFDQRVRPNTVVVNNTTIIHQTTNITNITMVNNHVHDGGPRPEVVAKAIGHDVRPVQAVQLRRQMEKPVAVKNPMLTHPHANHPANANAPQTNGPRGPVGNPAENHQPYGAPVNQAHPQTTNTVQHRPNESTTGAGQQHPSQTPQPNAVHPTGHPASQTTHPTTPPAHLNQQLNQLNAHPTMKPLHSENQSNQLHPSPTMKPLENRSNVNVMHTNRAPTVQPHAPQESHAPTIAPHENAPQPQPRPQLPRETNPVIVPHSSTPPVTSGANRSIVAPAQSAPETSHLPQHAVVQHPAPQPKTPPPPPPSQRRDDTQNQNQNQNQNQQQK
jgi:hypothetical protein